MNVNGYVGMNTVGEIFGAAALSKTIIALEPRFLAGAYPHDLHEEPSIRPFVHACCSTPEALCRYVFNMDEGFDLTPDPSMPEACPTGTSGDRHMGSSPAGEGRRRRSCPHTAGPTMRASTAERNYAELVPSDGASLPVLPEYPPPWQGRGRERGHG
jgi:hypothetical protein